MKLLVELEARHLASLSVTLDMLDEIDTPLNWEAIRDLNQLEAKLEKAWKEAQKPIYVAGKCSICGHDSSRQYAIVSDVYRIGLAEVRDFKCVDCGQTVTVTVGLVD